MSDGSHRRVLVAAMVVFGLAFSGCLTLDPTVATTDDSSVFESLSVSEPWASQQVRVNATLSSSPDAGNVTQITVIKENGETFSTAEVAPGQTSVLLELPANRNATLVSSDTINGTTLDTFNVSTGGNKII